MKKIFLFVSMVLLLIGCGSDDGGNSNTFISNVAIDGTDFKPNQGFYGINPQQEGDLHREMYFNMQRENSDEAMNIALMIPFSKTDITGTYDFGPGMADDLLVSGGFSRGEEYYSIIGYSLEVTELGDSKFRFEFTAPEALDVNEGFTSKPFTGNTIEGRFILQD